jgi:surface protein
MVEPILAPNSTWFSQGGTTIKRSQITSIDIVDTYDTTGKTIVDQWDASTESTGAADNEGPVTAYVESDGNGGYKLTLAGNGYGKVFANADSKYAFSYSTAASAFVNATAIEGLALLDTSKVTTMQAMFRFLPKVTALDVSDWDTSNVTDMSTVFAGNDIYSMGLTSLDVSKWDTGNVTSIYGAFQYCQSLKNLDLSNWNVGKVGTTTGSYGMYMMFNHCENLESIGDVGNWNVSKVNNMAGMFQACHALKNVNVSNWVTSACKNMSFMFSKCNSLETLDVSNWNTSACTDMSSMFQQCTSLAKLDVSGWDVSKVTKFSNMFAGGNLGVPAMIISELDVSNWDTSSATDMSNMFYGCQGPKSIDVSGWDVSKVKTFDHMFAHSYLTIGDVGNWTTPAATNMNAMFYSVQNTNLDVSNLITSKVTCFDQMFELCNKATEIIGLENFDTSNGLGFSEMFGGCIQLKELDLSSFDTTKAKDGANASTNGSKTTTMQGMFTAMVSLEKITLGEKFSFNGDGTTAVPENVAVLPIPGADGNWYDMIGNAFAPSDVPDKVFGVYYASQKIAEEDMNEMVLVKKGNLMRTAAAIRTKLGSTKGYTHEEFADAILSN